METIDVSMTVTLTASEYATLCAFANDEVRDPAAHLLWIVRQGLRYHDERQQMLEQLAVVKDMIAQKLREGDA